MAARQPSPRRAGSAARGRAGRLMDEGPEQGGRAMSHHHARRLALLVLPLALIGAAPWHGGTPAPPSPPSPGPSDAGPPSGSFGGPTPSSTGGGSKGAGGSAGGKGDNPG